MALTESTQLPLGTKAPGFRLPDTNGTVRSLSDFDSAPALLVVIMCNHCPYVVHIKKALAAFAAEYETRGLAVVGINANDPDHYPADAPAKMAEDVAAFGYTFPYLFDLAQDVAKAYRAVCTPEFYLFDGERKLVYHGQFDSSRPGGGEAATGADMRAAADAVLAGRAYDGPQTPSAGCSIKWRPGNAPDYLG